MICLLLIMTIIFINSIESAEQKIKHSDTLLNEEDMTAKTKIWLLMVESGKVDQEELRKITPKSIFIAPLLTSRTGKCKEGYRHDHLGQCVKVIKIDPKVQLELLLQRLNQFYSEKKEVKEEQNEEEATEETEVSNGPLHFSLPISSVNEKIEKENSENKFGTSQKDHNVTESIDPQESATTPEFTLISSLMIHQNQTDQIKDIESSGVEPLNFTEPIGSSELEGSGENPVASGDGFLEEESTTASPVSILSEETDYFDVTGTEPATAVEMQFTAVPPLEEHPSIKSEIEVPFSESYQNTTDAPSINDLSAVLPKKNIQVQKEIIIKNNSKSDKIIFPSDDIDVNVRNDASPQNNRIRFPDEVSQPPSSKHHTLLELNSKSDKYPTHSIAMPREQFWWLPKNWQIDENQQKSPLVKVWSRLPLMHDISYSRETSKSYKKSDSEEQPHTQMLNAQYKDKEFLEDQQPPAIMVKPFRSSRFQDILFNQRQHFRLQR